MRLSRFSFIVLALMLSVSAAFAQAIGGSKVSNLPFASTPFSGGELLYIIQGGQSRKTSVSTLASQTVSGGLTGLLYGNGLGNPLTAVQLGTSGATIPLNNGNNTTSGNNTHNGAETFNGANVFTGTVTLPAGTAATNLGGGTAQTGYLYGNGSGAATGSTTIPSAAISGVIPSSQISAATAAFHVSGSNLATTGSISANSGTLTAASARDFVVGQGIRVNHAGPAFTLNAPTGGTATPTGTVGSTTYQYKIAALDPNGGVSAAAGSFQTTTGNATLSATNFNYLTWTASSGTAPAGYAVYKNISGTYTLIGVTPDNTFNDYGFLSYTALDWIPATAPASALADWLVTTISGIAGTTFTLAATATTAATAQGVYHDDTAGLQAYFAANFSAPLPVGRFLVSSQINIPAYVQITGAAQWQSVITSAQIYSYILNLNYGDNVGNLAFQTPTLNVAMGVFNVNSININNVTCQDGSTGGHSSYCMYVSGSATINATNMTLQGWPAITSGQTTGGGIPGINVQSGTGVNLSNIQAFNNNATPTANQATVWFNSCFNCTIVNSNLNNNGNVVSPNSSGILVSGSSQADIISANQILGYTSNVRVDNATGVGLLTVDISANHFDFCAQYCILFEQGSWFTVTGNSFAGEHTAGVTGIYWAATAPYGPNAVTANTFDGFDGTGAANIQMSSSQVQTVIADNSFTHSGTPAIVTSGASVVVHDNPGYNPVGTFQSTYAPASGATYTAGASPETHYLVGGTVTAVTIPAGSGSNVCTATPCTMVLGPGETFSVTYSAAPQDIKTIH